MFAYLKGRLERKTPTVAVVDVGGVGYHLQIPLSTFYELGGVGQEVTLRITTQLRDDSILLYGFLTEGEQEMFAHLVTVSGIGARIAIAVLSGMSVAEIATALAGGDSARLRSIPGIGRKTAERLVVELKDRVGSLAEAEPAGVPEPSTDGIRSDVVSALVNLGYASGQAERATDAVLAEASAEPEFKDLLRETLRRLHR